MRMGAPPVVAACRHHDAGHRYAIPNRGTRRSPVAAFRGSAPITPEWKHFRVTREDGVCAVTFDRPERLNALTFEVYADLRDFFAELPHRGDAKVVVLRGEGRAFCS